MDKIAAALSNSKSARLLFACVLVATVPALLSLGAVSATASAVKTLDTFADGNGTAALSFTGCDAGESPLNLSFPPGSFVINGSVEVGVWGSSMAQSGYVYFDVGANGSKDFTRTIDYGGPTLFRLPAEPFNEFLALHPNTSGNTTVPVAVSSCPTGGDWNLTFQGLAVFYTEDGGRPPTTSGPPWPTVYLVAGESNYSAVDLASLFSDPNNDTLAYVIELHYAWEDDRGSQMGTYPAADSGLIASLNGTRVDVHASNASYWGGGTFYIHAVDPSGLSAPEGYLYVVTLPNASVVKPVTEDFVIAGAIRASACPSPPFTGQVRLPAVDIVLWAAVHFQIDDHNTTGGSHTIAGLNATVVEIWVGGLLAGRNTAYELDEWMTLDAAVVNAHLASQAASGGTISFDFSVVVCAPMGTMALWVEVAQVKHVRGDGSWGSAGSPALPSGIGLSVQGSSAREVAAGAPVELRLENASEPGLIVAWYVDGKRAGTGGSLSVSLEAGDHNVTAIVSNATHSKGQSWQIVAKGAGAGPGPEGPAMIPWAVYGLVAAVAGAGALGAVALWKRQR